MFKMTTRHTSRLSLHGLLALAALSAPLSACGDDTGGAGGGGGGGTGVDPQLVEATVQAYAAHVATSYFLALDGALDLESAVRELVQAPSVETLDDARAAWLAARPAYLRTEAFRFYGGPIDDEETGPEGRINGWPLDENYIDYVLGAGGEVLETGLINLPEEMPNITKEAIAEANEIGGEKNLSAGYHAIEFLLWGQDLSESGPGARPHTDYLVEGGTAPNPQRRGLYLTEVTALLVEDLASVTKAWDPSGEAGAPSYAESFVADDPMVSLTKILVGMGSLSGAELTSERINNAFQERDQEEEHSCFSDTTHLDHQNDLKGIDDVYRSGLDELLGGVDAELEAKMSADLEAARIAIAAIPAPFDQAIQDDAPGGGREAIAAAMDALTTLTTTTVAVADTLGVTLNLE